MRLLPLLHGREANCQQRLNGRLLVNRCNGGIVGNGLKVLIYHILDLKRHQEPLVNTMENLWWIKWFYEVPVLLLPRDIVASRIVTFLSPIKGGNSLVFDW